jgi:hypothetical protein
MDNTLSSGVNEKGRPEVAPTKRSPGLREQNFFRVRDDLGAPRITDRLPRVNVNEPPAVSARRALLDSD